MSVVHPHEVVVTTVGEQLSRNTEPAVIFQLSPNTKFTYSVRVFYFYKSVPR